MKLKTKSTRRRESRVQKERPTTVESRVQKEKAHHSKACIISSSIMPSMARFAIVYISRFLYIGCHVLNKNNCNTKKIKIKTQI